MSSREISQEAAWAMYTALKDILSASRQTIHGRPTPAQWNAGLKALAMVTLGPRVDLAEVEADVADQAAQHGAQKARAEALRARRPIDADAVHADVARRYPNILKRLGDG